MDTSISLLTAVLYIVAGLLLGLRLFHTEGRWLPPRNLALTVMVAGLLAHVILLADYMVTPIGLNFSFYTAMSLVSWLVVAMLLVSSLDKPVENLGIFLMPIAAISIILDWKNPGFRLLPMDASWGLGLHVLISILAYSTLTLASLQAILLSIQDQHLHKGHPGGFVRVLPPLQTMEAFLFELIGLGFILLTLGLLSGFMFVDDLLAQRLIHKTVLSVLAWLVFGVLLFGRLRFGWRGRRAVIGTLSGFAFLMLAYFGSKLVIEIILQN
ncbi:MAG: cytochrome c biogenesis protein CcsA [gamma proteobacterium symbiont of Bathyaustriella thionipta]|nr:cytochrome c biogenesis protein CcsA [gamma proteobacterium symbiont of Bathyaustriella thionipta]